MEELTVTTFWMGGVVAMMLIFGAIAVVGLYQQKRAQKND